jgi:hypothetical protein
MRKQGVMVREGTVKIGRNEDCPCGSGMKYKNCCGGATGIRGWFRRRRALRARKEAG